jgi:DNA repair protein RadC
MGRSFIRECPAHYLSDVEVVAGLLGNYDAAEEVLRIACGSLSGLYDLDICDLTKVKGIGKVRAYRLKAALDIARRLSDLALQSKVSITCPKKVADLFMAELRYQKQEHFMVLLLNAKNHPVSKELVTIGSLDTSIVHPREVFCTAIKKRAHSIIVVHNHPSGDPYPSEDDLNVTKKLVDAGGVVGIPVRDHVVIGDGRYFSFKEAGLI